MRKNVTDFVKNCSKCSRYKASNYKPSGLFQKPMYAQRFEILSINLFGHLSETKSAEKLILTVLNYSIK